MRLFVYQTISAAANNCLLLCNFLPWSEDQKVEILRSVTGWDSNLWELMKVGERSINMARAFTIREGFTRRDDRLPDRFYHPPTSGPLSKTAVDPEELERAKDLYYGMMNWDRDRGAPTRAKLEELDIPWVADELGLP